MLFTCVENDFGIITVHFKSNDSLNYITFTLLLYECKGKFYNRAEDYESRKGFKMTHPDVEFLFH